MLSHPALVLALVGSDTQREALLAQQNVAAVSGVDGPNGVVLGELDNISVLRIDIGFGVEAANEIVGLVAQLLESAGTHSGHNIHVENNIDGVGDLNANLGESRTDGTHGIGDDIHGSVFHDAIIHGGQFGVHLLGIHPVVGGTCILFFAGADEGSILDAGNVVGQSTMIQASRQLLRVETSHLTGGNSLVFQSIQLLIAAVNPNNLSGFGQGDHFIDPFEYIWVFCQSHNLCSPFNRQSRIKIGRNKAKSLQIRL